MILQQPFGIPRGTGQLYYSPISINAAQVPSTQTDFPVLVSVTDARFKTTGNGGHVANSNGYDIRPYTDTTLGTAITGYELEKYVASTGELIMWVKVSSLSSSTTPIYLGYGDTSLTTDGSSTTTWSNSFLGVYHLKNGTTLDVNSATGSNNGTNHSATATTGQIDGAANVASASSQYIDCGTGMATTSTTLSAWIKATSYPNSYNTVITRAGEASMYVRSTGKLACYCTVVGGGSVAYDPGSHTMVSGTWYHVALTFTPSSNIGLFGYVNAANDGHVNSSTNLISTAASTYVGHDTISSPFNGAIDEARVSSVARSNDWLTTEYNNQNAPGTFETLGTEVAI